MAADIRIAKKGSGKVGLPEVSLGVLPGTGGTQRLSRMVGKSRSIELMVTGNLITYEQCLDWGIVNQVLDGDDFFDQVHKYAREFCPPNRAAKAVGRIKRSVQSGWEVPFESGDAKEGLAAYVEKRKPEFSGR